MINLIRVSFSEQAVRRLQIKLSESLKRAFSNNSFHKVLKKIQNNKLLCQRSLRQMLQPKMQRSKVKKRRRIKRRITAEQKTVKRKKESLRKTKRKRRRRRKRKSRRESASWRPRRQRLPG